MRNQTVSTKLATEGQKDDVRTTVLQATSTMLQSMTFDEAKTIQGDKSVLIDAITRALEPFIRTKSGQYWVDQWTKFYHEVFGLKCDFSKLRLPASREEFDWLVIADERVSDEVAAQKCATRFKVWRWTNNSFDTVIVHNDRSQKDGTYAVWVRDAVEADEVHRSKSAEAIWAAAVKGMTQRERLLLELFYEWQNPGKHLDNQNVTLCTGSRGSDGYVPFVRWYSGGRKLCVSLVSPGSADSSWRCREVVS